MILFTKINKKEQAITLRQKYFYLYDTFSNNKQEGNSNKFLPKIVSFL